MNYVMNALAVLVGMLAMLGLIVVYNAGLFLFVRIPQAMAQRALGEKQHLESIEKRKLELSKHYQQAKDVAARVSSGSEGEQAIVEAQARLAEVEAAIRGFEEQLKKGIWQ